MGRISANKLRKISDKDQKFVDLVTSPAYSKDNDGLRKAYEEAGWSGGPSALSNARTKMRDLSEHIQIRIHEKIGQHVPWALDMLVKLAKDSKNDQVKLKALLSILDRAGYNAPITVEHIKDDPSEMTKEELRKEIVAILKRTNKEPPDLKVVGKE